MVSYENAHPEIYLRYHPHFSVSPPLKSLIKIIALLALICINISLKNKLQGIINIKITRQREDLFKMAKTSKSDSKSKSKIAVSIKTHKKATTTSTQKSLAGKKAKAQKPKPKLAQGLPLSSDPVPSNSISSTRLTPGNILQKCSGSDIKITKNCDAKPNLAIGRGRFLFILPGLLSLKQPTQDANKTLSGSTLFTMGKIFGLDTKTPTMKIDLPSGAQMILKGKKISSTSRYLVLTCKTSGNIQCKNMFQEMVMFESCTLQGDVSDKKIASEEKEQQKFNHYGGSDRALDGGREVRGIKKKEKAKALVRGDSVMSDINQSQSQETGLEQSQTSISIEDSDDQGIGNDIIEIEEDSDDSDAVKFKLDSPVVPRSKSSRRSTSKKVNYSQESEEEESSNDSSDNDSIDDEDEDHGIQSKTIKKTAKDPSERKKSSRVDIELDSDSDSEVEEIVASPIKPRQRSSSVRSSASKAINYSQESESDDDIVSDDSEIDDNDNEDDTSDFEIEQDPKPKQKRAPAKKATKDTDVKPSKSATTKGNAKNPRRTPNKTKTKTSPNESSKKKKGELTTTKKKSASAVKKTSSTVNKEKDLDIADGKKAATKRSGPLSPSFRKRRKGSTPKKSPSRSLDVTLGDDEDFAFIE